MNLRSGRAKAALEQVRAFAEPRAAAVVLTERARHAAELAQTALADGCELIVAVGGDGTMNEVAGTLLGPRGILGLVPCGSGDGLGRHLGIHGSIARALDILDTGTPRTIDTGVADGHPFFTVAGLGFEAEIAEKFNRLERRGFVRYLTTSASAWLEWQPADYIVTHAEGREEIRAFTIAVANGDQYGNNARIAPLARVDDGVLDLCAVPPVNVVNAGPLLSCLFTGILPRMPGVILRRGERFTIERAAAGPIHTDGEVHAAGRTVEFAVRPASLRIMAPKVRLPVPPKP